MNNRLIKNILVTGIAFTALCSFHVFNGENLIHADEHKVYVSKMDYDTMNALQKNLSKDDRTISLDDKGKLSYTDNKNNKYLIDDANNPNTSSGKYYASIIGKIMNAMKDNNITKVLYDDAKGYAIDQHNNKIDVIQKDDSANNSNFVPVPNNTVIPNNNDTNKSKNDNQHKDANVSKDNTSNNKSGSNNGAKKDRNRKNTFKSATIKSLNKKNSSINKQLSNKHLNKNVRKALVAQRTELRKQVKSTKNLYKAQDRLNNKKLGAKERKKLVTKIKNLKAEILHEQQLVNLNQKLSNKHLSRKERNKINKAIKDDNKVNKLQKELRHKHLSHKNKIRLNKEIKSLRNAFNQIAK